VSHLGNNVTEYFDDDATILVCFGPGAFEVPTDDVAAAQSMLDDLVPGLEVLDATGHNWVEDQYAGETWRMHYAGHLTECFEGLQQPDGRDTWPARITRRVGVDSSTAPLRVA